MSSISELRFNYFSALDYESDDELCNEKRIEEEIVQQKKKEKRKASQERQRLYEKQKKKDKEYTHRLKRTKIIKSDGDKRFDYVCEIIEDGCNIANYLNLDSFLHTSVISSSLFYRTFDREEYLYLVKIMETSKNPVYYDFHKCLEQMMSITDTRIFNCLFQTRDTYGKIIYELYKYFLWDTPNMRKVFNEEPHLKKIIDESLKEIIENSYGNSSEIEQEYITRYFELGKRFYAKRNNFKILFRNYCRFIGKVMIILKNR